MIDSAPTTSPPELAHDLPEGVEGWEAPISELLTELSATQTALLSVLERKRELLVRVDREGLAALEPEERSLADRLAACQRRRRAMLAAAGRLGLPGGNLRLLADAMPDGPRRSLRPRLREAQAQARILQHQCLANWVLVQRTLLHLSQMIEIVATGGQKAPTYEKTGPSKTGGVLMDRAV